MSDNVYRGKPKDESELSKTDKDTGGDEKRPLDVFDDPPPVGADFLTDKPQRQPSLIAYRESEMEAGYRLGIKVERNRIYESFGEYCKQMRLEGRVMVPFVMVQGFFDWYLDQ